jgi:hypothetical protein
MMRRDANATKTAISKHTCEVQKTLPGGECRNPGEVLYGEALLCLPHATLLGLEDRAEALLSRVLRMDEWLEENGSSGADEECLGRIRHEREEALAALRLIRVQIRSARKEVLQ